MKCGDPTNPGGIGHKSNGDPCNRGCAPGMTRCNLHGGNNPAAKIKAEQMLAQARLPACEALFDIIDMWERTTCAACGFPSGDVGMLKTIIRAAQVILDRSGMGPRATVEMVHQTDGDLDLEMLTEPEMEELDGLLTQVKELKARIHFRLGTLAGTLPAAPMPDTVQ
jgi:hypothetical protein